MLIIWENKEVPEVNIGKIRKFQGVKMGKIRKFDEVFYANKELFRIFAIVFYKYTIGVQERCVIEMPKCNYLKIITNTIIGPKGYFIN